MLWLPGAPCVVLYIYVYTANCVCTAAIIEGMHTTSSCSRTSMYKQLPDNIRGMVNLPLVSHFRCHHTAHAMLIHFAVAVQPSTAIIHIEAHVLYAYENELVHKNVR